MPFTLRKQPKLKALSKITNSRKIVSNGRGVFGLSTMPFLWQKLMNTFLKLWRTLGFTVFIYLDDILILNQSRENLKGNKKKEEYFQTLFVCSFFILLVLYSLISLFNKSISLIFRLIPQACLCHQNLIKIPKRLRELVNKLV